ncbi:monofunctional biosynthetic peptidoglycan transglycosylase [Albidovulum aquaemixtae]|uniref:monofunctional biosynthetic peptidoglycan transglycosylase n=1 Tax=Albidovulum aquaemixtae TaxID=1542388 RepID=UPI000D55A26D|nr:monofunctional biosynthetic peptidoglycan transglycosylase [Defluviimonas aquaemixtae]
MAKSRTTGKRTTAKKKKAPRGPARPLWRRALRRVLRGAAGMALLWFVLVLLFTFVNPVMTPYMIAESWRQGGVKRDWVRLEEMTPALARSVVAAEDANYCLHWGFDMAAIRAALDEGAGRGASTLSQQVVKNVFLWQGRSWPRKALEALMTPVVELIWTKKRIVEVYLNVAETGKGVFGAEAAARAYFGTSAADLSAGQAALIAAALPDPKGRNPARPSGFLRSRARAIADGAATIRADGRAACFED